MRALLAAVAVVLFTTVPLTAPAMAGAVTVDQAGAVQLLALVNAERARHGLVPVSRDARLEAIAVAYTQEMARTGVLAHNDALFTRATHQALGIKIFAENVDCDATVPSSHQDFMNSPPHRDNLLGAAYRLAGFAVVHDDKGAIWVTEDFGTARVAATIAAKPAPRPAPKPATRSRPKAKPVVRLAAKPAPKVVAKLHVAVARPKPAVRRTPPDPYAGSEALDVRTVAANRPAPNEAAIWGQLLIALAFVRLRRRLW